MNNVIFLKYFLIDYEDLTNEGLLSYIALRSKYYSKTDSSNIKWIYYDDLFNNLTGLNSCNKKYIKKIKSGIKNLDELGEIKIIKLKKDKVKIEFLDSYYFDTENYTVTIYLNEVYKIMHSNFKHNQKDKLLRYFVCKISSFMFDVFDIFDDNGRHYNQFKLNSSNGSIGIEDTKFPAELANINLDNIDKYDKWLEENKLLYILHSIRDLTDCYSRPKDINKLETLYKTREEHPNMFRF